MQSKMEYQTPRFREKEISHILSPFHANLDNKSGDVVLIGGESYTRIVGVISCQVEAGCPPAFLKTLTKKISGLIVLELLYHSRASDLIFKTLVSMLCVTSKKSTDVSISPHQSCQVINFTLRYFTKFPSLRSSDHPDEIWGQCRGFSLPQTGQGPGFVNYKFSHSCKPLSVRELSTATSRLFNGLEDNTKDMCCQKTSQALIDNGIQAGGFDIKVLLPLLNLSISGETEKTVGNFKTDKWIAQSSRLNGHEFRYNQNLKKNSSTTNSEQAAQTSHNRMMSRIFGKTPSLK